jgi:pimeloyl-ACP methyl ester carboxylesterase
MSKVKIAALLAATFAAAGGGVFVIFDRQMREIRRRVEAGSRIVTTRLGPIECATRGSGSPLLLIHGAGGGYDQGLFIAENLPKSFQVIAPSRFGYLRTPVPADVSPAAQANAHVALLDSLGIERAVVMGVSAGAPSAVEMALHHAKRVRALILMVPRGYAPNHKVEVPANWSNAQVMKLMLSGSDLAYWAALKLMRRKLVRFMGVPPDLEASAPVAEQERISLILKNLLPLSQRISGIRAEGEALLTPLPLEQINVPTLIISAKDDLFGTLPAAEYMAERIPEATLIVFESGGHLLVGRQLQVNEKIANFLSSIETVQEYAAQARSAHAEF